MYVYPLAENPVCIQLLRAYRRIRDVETQSPGMLRKPEDLPYPCPRPENIKRLATRDTLHRSRPNLRQRDRMGRIVPTSSDVSGKERCKHKKVCPKKKKPGNYTYTYIVVLKGIGQTDTYRVEERKKIMVRADKEAAVTRVRRCR